MQRISHRTQQTNQREKQRAPYCALNADAAYLCGTIIEARRCVLLGRMREDRRAVLRADIIALPIKLRRIMRRKMNVEDVGVADKCRIISHPNCLGMAGIAAAYLLVSRIDNAAADIATLHRNYPGQALKHRLNAPKTAASDDTR